MAFSIDLEKQKAKADAFRRGIVVRASCSCRMRGTWPVPGLRDAKSIGRLVQDLQCPVNVLAGPGFSFVPELEKLGVARVSLGSGPMRATLGLLRKMAEELKTTGTYQTMEGAPSHADVNRMMG